MIGRIVARPSGYACTCYCLCSNRQVRFAFFKNNVIKLKFFFDPDKSHPVFPYDPLQKKYISVPCGNPHWQIVSKKGEDEGEWAQFGPQSAIVCMI